ncbi:MAG: helix-turn-helix domain-containing protein [Spartobacteria bacterium]|nr:helix-turn-helix domain-containing protein [Spartobacteria bacterium]
MVEIDDRWLSVDEICKYLGIGKDTVYKWVDKYDMPAHRMGRLWKFKKDQVYSQPPRGMLFLFR